MKKVLLTNFSITQFSGSEIDTLTVANYFLKNGWDVTIFTLEYGKPLIQEVDKRIKLIDYYDINKLSKHYDLLWAHHYPLVDYLLLAKKIKFDYIHYISLSGYMAYESLPIYYKELNYVSILSKEALHNLEEEKHDVSKIHIFTNYSFEKYFKYKNKNNKTIKRIAIVSNHIPNELIKIEELLKKKDIELDIYGIGYKYEKVDEKLLSKYDVIISIGKTINYALSLGIPCYCYDRFGGDGYITMENVEDSLSYNFSGRYLHKKKTPKAIVDEIIGEYGAVLKDIADLKQFAYDNFCFEKRMEEVLKDIFKTEKFDLDEVIKKYPAEVRKSSLFVEAVGSKNELLKRYCYPLEFIQIFYEVNGEFLEEKSEIIPLIQKDNNIYYAQFKIPNKIEKIRVDYSNKAFCLLKEVKINGRKRDDLYYINTINYNKAQMSINDDPSFILYKNEFRGRTIKIELNMEFLDSFDVINSLVYKTISGKKAKLKKKLKKMLIRK